MRVARGQAFTAPGDVRQGDALLCASLLESGRLRALVLELVIVFMVARTSDVRFEVTASDRGAIIITFHRYVVRGIAPGVDHLTRAAVRVGGRVGK